MHRVYSDFLPTHVAMSAAAAFPDMSWQWWHRYHCAHANKYGSVDAIRLPEACREALRIAACRIGDKYYSPGLPADGFVDYDFHAGGMHLMTPGGFLAPHVDAEWHPLRPWRRLGSLVVFVQPAEVHGGSLIVGSSEIAPSFNRAVWISVDEIHSVSTVHEGPDRLSLALFVWQRGNKPQDATTTANFQV